MINSSSLQKFVRSKSFSYNDIKVILNWDTSLQGFYSFDSLSSKVRRACDLTGPGSGVQIYRCIFGFVSSFAETIGQSCLATVRLFKFTDAIARCIANEILKRFINYNAYNVKYVHHRYGYHFELKTALFFRIDGVGKPEDSCSEIGVRWHPPRFSVRCKYLPARADRIDKFLDSSSIIRCAHKES